MNKILFVLAFALTVSSCTKNSKPTGLIPEDKMAQVLTDLHRSDALLMQAVNKRMVSATKTSQFYIDLFKKHEITREQFDNSYTYYSKDFRAFEQMYDQVLANLQKELDSLSPGGKRKK